MVKEFLLICFAIASQPSVIRERPVALQGGGVISRSQDPVPSLSALALDDRRHPAEQLSAREIARSREVRCGVLAQAEAR
jgi:hypothetical protein